MTIRRSTAEFNRIVNIDGPAGNAYMLLGLATNLAKQLGYSKVSTEDLLNDMKAGNYIHLLKVFNDHFGELITLETDNEVYLEILGGD